MRTRFPVRNGTTPLLKPKKIGKRLKVRAVYSSYWLKTVRRTTVLRNGEWMAPDEGLIVSGMESYH